ncbi:conserved hypothetical protein [Xylanimonas cellulosilytica DSM 15894]|uniref:Coenzyme F420 biosynthesis-associated protein n=1 Tax=Xylanimonas cellulosilytica (strain DSM 15894 / JCM 12276 / CECT 5975 / KCTC 9989 / LMG 20990 / NBRC 107835 / XIL07) TaxID=446471 RepID=D1BZ99_XYLCX|nr:zinc-dependent metalloprotease [Xylanimonas cellulosilytica]ACZ31996.1 conserved hypothetical protein [Xylanimonas cellulosilytica DSM 15894]
MTTDPRPAPTPEVVDWSAAAELAARVAPPGPRATRDELAALVGGLRDAASDAVEHVLTTTRMTPVSTRPDGGVRRVVGGPRDGAAELGSVHVVDRARWALANTQVMAAMTAPVAAALGEESVPTSQSARLGGALEVGGLLALLAPRVLGQFDPYARLGTGTGNDDDGAGDGEPGPGRLLLVAPNVLHAERTMGVDPRDFRLWVCLHEQTHALQFSAAPWLAAHLRDRVGGLLEDVTRTAVGLAKAPLHQKLATAGRTVADVVTGVLRPGTAAPFEHLMTPAQKDELAAITAVMALLEGHADVMMDAVGPRVVRSVRQIRHRFDKRRDGEGAPRLDIVLRRLLGMDAKLAQYRDGAAFVRAVERKVGRRGLNAVWTSADALPTAREIADAAAWVRRVHG